MEIKNFTPEQIDELIEYLRGSCKSLDDGTEDLFNKNSLELSSRDTAQIDENIFLCDTCGWWFEISEMADNDNWECVYCD